MSRSAERRRPASRSQAGLFKRLEARRAEIEQAILTRVHSLEDPAETGDPTYVEGLRAAVRHAVGYALEGIERGESRPAPIPTPLFAQARHAARVGVPLATVLRRYFAGYTLLEDFIMQEAEQSLSIGSEGLHRLTRAQAAVFDRLVVAVTEEHGRELSGRPDTAEQRRAECVERLLAGGPADASELGYELPGWHVGAIAAGPGGEEGLRALADTMDRRLLLLPRGGGVVWGWLGGRTRVDLAEEVLPAASKRLPGGACIAFGEPGVDAKGWRLSHREAAAAWPVALRGPQPVVRYAEVALLASMLRDEALLASFEEAYLSPLLREADSGVLFQTLRAYFVAERNVTSTAAALGVSRPTVRARLTRIQDLLGRLFNDCAAEVDTALRLHELTPRVPRHLPL